METRYLLPIDFCNPVPEMSAKKVIVRMENCEHLPAEYWDALSASLRKLEIFSMRTSAIFPYAGPQLSAERSADICGHLCGRPHGLVRTSAWIGVDVRMDWCGRPHGCRCLRKSAWMGADVRRARGSVRVAPPAV